MEEDQGYIDLAAAQGCDAFVTGEVSEQTIHSAREQGIHFFCRGSSRNRTLWYKNIRRMAF